jgi:cell division septal protein FtsQ
VPRRRRTEEPPAPEPAPRPWLGRLLFKVAALLVGVGLFVAGVIGLGEYAQEQLRDRDRHTLPFPAIECLPPPPYQSRANFLDEVQYLARLPARVRLLDPDLGKQLAEGFAQHPWVRRVERVEVTPKAVRVRLVYRRPALAVPRGERVRVVDGEGILLPKEAPAEGLPVFKGSVSRPAGPAGTRWGDAAVEEAARKAEQGRGSP